ncbi:hypothetical protein ACWELO_34815 [Streptomyces sp. NPDC004596]
MVRLTYVGPQADSTDATITRTARRTPVAALVPTGSRPPGYARTRPSVPLTGVRLYYAVPEPPGG